FPPAAVEEVVSRGEAAEEAEFAAGGGRAPAGAEPAGRAPADALRQPGEPQDAAGPEPDRPDTSFGFGAGEPAAGHGGGPDVTDADLRAAMARSPGRNLLGEQLPPELHSKKS